LSPDVIVLGLRLIAILVVLVVVPLLWRIMSWLPWQVDCLVAAASALAFAYRFEREPLR